MANLQIIKDCNLNLFNPCIFQGQGIKKLYVSDLSNAEFVFEDNTIIDIFPATWYEIKFGTAKVNQTILKGTEDITLEIFVPLINVDNKFELSKLQKTNYNFLFVTVNDEVYYIDSAKNSQYIETYNPNGFTIKELSSQNKSLFQVNYNYYYFNFLTIPDIPVIIPCSYYYSDLFLSSVQPDMLSIDCLWSDYDGWI